MSLSKLNVVGTGFTSLEGLHHVEIFELEDTSIVERMHHVNIYELEDTSITRSTLVSSSDDDSSRANSSATSFSEPEPALRLALLRSGKSLTVPPIKLEEHERRTLARQVSIASSKSSWSHLSPADLLCPISESGMALPVPTFQVEVSAHERHGLARRDTGQSGKSLSYSQYEGCQGELPSPTQTFMARDAEVEASFVQMWRRHSRGYLNGEGITETWDFAPPPTSSAMAKSVMTDVPDRDNGKFQPRQATAEEFAALWREDVGSGILLAGEHDAETGRFMDELDELESGCGFDEYPASIFRGFRESLLEGMDEADIAALLEEGMLRR